MSLTNNTPDLDGVHFKDLRIVADDATPAVAGQNQISPKAKSVVVTGVANDANDWVILPNLADCPDGHRIVMIASAGANFEVRTPASSNEKINGQDSDGTKELLVTDTTVVLFTKISNSVGWMSNPFTAIGAVATAVVPD